MLCVKPVDDKQMVRAVMEQYRVKSESVRLLTAEEQGKTLGFILAEPQKDKLFLHAFEVCGCLDYVRPAGDDLEIAEYLVRAAGNYASNRLLAVLECADMPSLPLLRRFGFKQYNQKYRLELKVLFKKCENCGD